MQEKINVVRSDIIKTIEKESQRSTDNATRFEESLNGLKRRLDEIQLLITNIPVQNWILRQLVYDGMWSRRWSRRRKMPMDYR